MDEATRMSTLLNLLKVNASQFAKQTGIPQPSVSAITLGNKRITIEILHKIIQAYPAVSLDWLMKGTGDVFLDIGNISPSKATKDKGENNTINSLIVISPDGLPDDDQMRRNIAENLRLTAKRWGLTQLDLLELLGGSVGRQGASNYFKGDTLPRLPVLFRLERLTGWPLVVLAMQILEFDQIPASPLVFAPVEPSPLSTAEVQELRRELVRLRSRLGRIIGKIGSDEDYPNDETVVF